MATWSRAEKTTRTVEYTVPANEPWGATWNQVQQALSAAVTEWETRHEHKMHDDSVRVHTRDDEIVITFEVP